MQFYSPDWGRSSWCVWGWCLVGVMLGERWSAHLKKQVICIMSRLKPLPLWHRNSAKQVLLIISHNMECLSCLRVALIAGLRGMKERKWMLPPLPALPGTPVTRAERCNVMEWGAANRFLEVCSNCCFNRLLNSWTYANKVSKAKAYSGTRTLCKKL